MHLENERRAKFKKQLPFAHDIVFYFVLQNLTLVLYLHCVILYLRFVTNSEKPSDQEYLGDGPLAKELDHVPILIIYHLREPGSATLLGQVKVFSQQKKVFKPNRLLQDGVPITSALLLHEVLRGN